MTKTLKAIALLILLLAVALVIWKLSTTNQDSFEYWQQSNETNTETIDHSLWQQTLDEFLIRGTANGTNLVDYQGIIDNGHQTLTSYIKAMSRLNITQYSKTVQFAYWVNVYNALTVELITKHYPIDSITNIAGPLGSFGPWDNHAFTIAGKNLSLNDIEHQILRPIWNDYRIHFAVNCASIGCPNLQPKAFTALNSQTLLDLAAQQFINHNKGLQITPQGIVLSSIFDWYQEDFGANKTKLISVISTYLSLEKKQQLQEHSQQINYHYDWRLNDES